jgi:hypothetical protein
MVSPAIYGRGFGQKEKSDYSIKREQRIVANLGNLQKDETFYPK